MVGAYHFDKVEGAPINSVERRIAERFPHPDYNDRRISNDFLILKLDEPVYDLPTIQWNKDEMYPSDYEPVTVIGFGGTEPRADLFGEGGGGGGLEYMYGMAEFGSAAEFPQQQPRMGGDIALREVEVEVIPSDLCNSREMYSGYLDTDIMMCAGFAEGGKDACYGDSGGPLFTKSANGEYMQVGVVSFGAGCAREMRPGVYARISAVQDWIEETIGQNSPTNRSSSAPSSAPSQSAVPSSTPSEVPSYQPSSAPTLSLQPSPAPVPTESPTPPILWNPEALGISIDYKLWP